MTILSDHDIEGQARILWGALKAEGWAEILQLGLTEFAEVGLPANSNDRAVWRFAQANGMILLTANRQMKGIDSLAKTLREENGPLSLPVLTIGNVDRVKKKSYRDRCVDRIAEIIVDLKNHRGVGRLFIS